MLLCSTAPLPLTLAASPTYCQETRGTAGPSKLCSRLGAPSGLAGPGAFLCCLGCRPLGTKALAGHPVTCHLASAWPEKVIAPSRDKVHPAKNPQALEGGAQHSLARPEPLSGLWESCSRSMCPSSAQLCAGPLDVQDSTGEGCPVSPSQREMLSRPQGLGWEGNHSQSPAISES